MRKVALVVALMFIASAAWAGPKDKTKGALVNPSSCRGTTAFDNMVVKAKYQADAKQVKIQWKDTPALNGKTVYCFLDGKTFISVVAGGAVALDNTVVFKGAVDGGKLGIKGKLSTLAGYTATQTLSYDSTTECYVDNSGGTYDWGDPNNCGGLVLLQDTSTYADDGLEGICQGAFITNFPDTVPLAVAGSGSFPDDAPACTAP